MALTDKQKRFANEYLVDLNAKKAAIRAGYSEKTAEQMGYQLLQKTSVLEFISNRQKAIESRTEITQDKVIAELAKIGFADATDFTVEGAPLIDTNFKASTKVKALELLGKHLGIFTDKVEISKSTGETIADIEAYMASRREASC